MVRLNWVLVTFLIVYILHEIFVVWIEYLNRKNLKKKGTSVPVELEGFVDGNKYEKIVSYTRDNSVFSVIIQLVSATVLLVIILSGALPSLNNYLEKSLSNQILIGTIFIVVPSFLLFLIELPFDYYHTFVLENRYGFNTSTKRTWIGDQVKGALISFILLSFLIAVVLWTIKFSPGYWWMWAFLSVSVIQLLLTALYPVVIAPLFNKFEPLEDQILEKKVGSLMESSGFKVKGIFQMDAGKRSRHTNAYFTGLGKSKRIVLFDTLLASHPHDEILAVLSHEVGHYKGKHIIKQLLLFEISLMVGFYVAYLLLDWKQMYTTFGFSGIKPYAGLFFLSIFWGKAGFFLKPVYMAVSRKFERAADLFAARLLGSGESLATALKRMVADNLSNLNPHPLYVWFNYSHPPILDRIRKLESYKP